MKCRPVLIRAVAVILCLCPVAAFGETLTVHLDRPMGPARHVASGALYGIAGPGWPPERWIAGIHPTNFTQMAPGGRQLPNGETHPVGDALEVAPIAAAAGASITVRMADTFPSFPYVWQGEAFWKQAVEGIVASVARVDPPNLYGYEIWNEPDWTWRPAWGDFDAMWAETAAMIHAADADARIVGPSLSRWNADWMHRFLKAAMASGSVPDIVSWHELDPKDADAIEAHVEAYRDMEKTLGLAARPVSINEYGSPRAAGNPGLLVHYLAQLERAGVDTADLAFWHRPGRLSDLLAPREGGTGPARDPVPTGAYWLYTWYGGMTGKMVVATSPGPDLDGLAAFDPTDRVATIILGGSTGPDTVIVTGLEPLGDTVDVSAIVTHWTGTDGGSPAPAPLFDGSYGVEDGRIAVKMPKVMGSDAIRLLVTPAATHLAPGASTVHPAERPWSRRFEAESGTVTGGRKFTIRMSRGNFFANTVSGNAYVGLFNSPRARAGIAVRVPRAGLYRLTLGYSNGRPAPLRYRVDVNGTELAMLELAPTQGRELIRQVAVDARLPKGKSTVSVAAGATVKGFFGAPSVLELDYLDVTASDATR